MATLLHSESRRLYSWWWDSHISPKNSKWLQDNLTDMDAKVKAMIKLIEEDADSFARRAEMYYKKRPELMKLVEEFYRAYRALAERYDHATVELRQAHRTMAEAFPNQVPNVLADDSPSGSIVTDGEPHTPEMPHPIRALCDLDDLHMDAVGLSSTSLHMQKNGENSERSASGCHRRGLKQLSEMLVSVDMPENAITQLSMENAWKFGAEIQTLKKALTKIEAEKEAVFLKYQQALEKLSDLEREFNDAQSAAGGLDERASKAETEIKLLKEAMLELQAERDAGLVRYGQCQERMSRLETKLSLAEEDSKGLNERAKIAETEAQNLRQQLFNLESEKEASLRQHLQCLEKTSVLESKISIAEENARMLNDHIERVEAEAKVLRKALDDLNKEKEIASLQYKQCLETIEKMESEAYEARDDSKRLNGELLAVAGELDSSIERCSHLEQSNRSLQSEADNLVEKIAMKDQELAQRHDELKKLQIQMQEEQSRFMQVETTFHTLQKLHFQSQEEQKSLTMELKNGLQMLKDLDIRKHSMEEELQRVKEENRSLNELKFSSTLSVKNLENEIFSLKEMKDKLEKEVVRKTDQSNALEQEIGRLKDEINSSNERYQAIMKQVDTIGMNPECLESSVKDLKDENVKLREAYENERNKRDALYEKLSLMDKISKNNAILEISSAEMKGELEGLREKIKQFQESCQFLQGEKSSLVREKATLLSQLQITTENMQKILEKNTLLEISLSGANVELEGLRAKSESLEEICQLLKNDKSSLLNERSALVSQLEDVELRLGNLEKRFSKLEEKYYGIENEKEATLHQVKELQSSLIVEKQEHASYKQSNEARLAGLENHVHILQEESRMGKKELEEELEKAVNAQVEIFILQMFIEDLEGKNLSLFIECQKLHEASKFSDTLISELESENLEQQVEIEFLLDKLEKLRVGIYQVFKALQFDADNEHDNKIERGQIPVLDILDTINELKTSSVRNNDEKQQLLVENLVLLTFLGQLGSDAAELQSQRYILEQEFEFTKEQLAMHEKDNYKLLEITNQLMSEANQSEQQEQASMAEIASLNLKLVNLQGRYMVLHEENSNILQEKRSVLKKYMDLKAANCTLEEDHAEILQEAVALGISSLVFESFMVEKALEMKALLEDLHHLHVINGELTDKVTTLGEKLEVREAENLYLNKSVEKLNGELCEAKDSNDQLSHQIFIGNDFVKQKVEELSEAEKDLKATQNRNTNLCDTIEELKVECKELTVIRQNLENSNLELCLSSKSQESEIEQLQQMNENLRCEVGVLSKEVEEYKAREENLNSELREKRNEFELWEAEADTFYFDLHISTVREVLLENKLHELSRVCESIGDESAGKSAEIQHLRERVTTLEGEVEGLKAQLSAYVPAIASLRSNVESLEHNVLPRNSCGDGQKGKEITVYFGDNSCEELEDRNTESPDAISDLQKVEARIKAVEKAVLKEKEILAKQQNVNSNFEVKPAMIWSKEFKSERTSSQDHIKNEGVDMDLTYGVTNNLKSRKNKSDYGILMKDIPLDQVSDFSSYRQSKRESCDANDQMLELWEATEQDNIQDPLVDKIQKQARPPIACHPVEDVEHNGSDSSSELQAEKELGIDRLETSSSIRETVPNRADKKSKMLDRLASDAQKLLNLQATVHDLKKKLMLNNHKKRGNNIEHETVNRQLKEVEEAVLLLVNVNGQLSKEIEHAPSSSEGKTSPQMEGGNVPSRNSVTEQARKGSEKMGRLQFEVQNIQHVLLKLEGDKKRKGKMRFSKSKTGILLKDFIYSSRRKNERRKKGCFCGCTRPSTNEE